MFVFIKFFTRLLSVVLLFAELPDRIVGLLIERLLLLLRPLAVVVFKVEFIFERSNRPLAVELEAVALFCWIGIKLEGFKEIALITGGAVLLLITLLPPLFGGKSFKTLRMVAVVPDCTLIGIDWEFWFKLLLLFVVFILRDWESTNEFVEALALIVVVIGFDCELGDDDMKRFLGPVKVSIVGVVAWLIFDNMLAVVGFELFDVWDCVKPKIWIPPVDVIILDLKLGPLFILETDNTSSRLSGRGSVLITSDLLSLYDVLRLVATFILIKSFPGLFEMKSLFFTSWLAVVLITLLDEDVTDDDDDESIATGATVVTDTTEAAFVCDGGGVDEAAAAGNAVEDTLIWLFLSLFD